MKKKENKPMHIFIFPLVPKICSICERANPMSAKCCAYCGSNFVITRIRQNDKSPSNATEGEAESFI